MIGPLLASQGTNLFSSRCAAHSLQHVFWLPSMLSAKYLQPYHNLLTLTSYFFIARHRFSNLLSSLVPNHIHLIPLPPLPPNSPFFETQAHPFFCALAPEHWPISPLEMFSPLLAVSRLVTTLPLLTYWALPRATWAIWTFLVALSRVLLNRILLPKRFKGYFIAGLWRSVLSKMFQRFYISNENSTRNNSIVLAYCPPTPTSNIITPFPDFY